MITLYDIDSKLPGRAWSPNTFKARIALNYKGIPYQTEWVEYPDIETVCKKIGALPTEKKADGRDHYTLPVIYDSTTKKAISDSKRIALYLEETYPNTPALFPKATISDGVTLSTEGAIALFEYFFMTSGGAMFPFMLFLTNNTLNPRSEEYFRRTREETYGKRMEEFSPPGSEKRAEDWAKLQEGLGKVDKILSQNSSEAGYCLGDVFSYGDVAILGFMVWIKLLVDPKEWEAVAGWHGGRWDKLLKATEEYQIAI